MQPSPQSESSRRDGPTAEPSATEDSIRPSQVTLRLEQVFPWLAEAVQHDAAWLNDFGEDRISIPVDLYEVILAYQHFHQG